MDETKKGTGPHAQQEAKSLLKETRFPLEIIQRIVHFCDADGSKHFQLDSDINIGIARKYPTGYLAWSKDTRLFALSRVSKALRSFVMPLLWHTIRLDSALSILAFSRFLVNAQKHNMLPLYSEHVRLLRFAWTNTMPFECNPRSWDLHALRKAQLSGQVETDGADGYGVLKGLGSDQEVDKALIKIVSHLPKLESIEWNAQFLEITPKLACAIEAHCKALQRVQLTGEVDRGARDQADCCDYHTHEDDEEQFSSLENMMTVVESLEIEDCLRGVDIDVFTGDIEADDRYDVDEDSDDGYDRNEGDFSQRVEANTLIWGIRYGGTSVEVFLNLLFEACLRGLENKLRRLRLVDSKLLLSRMFLPLLLRLDVTIKSALAFSIQTPCERALKHLSAHIHAWPNKEGDWVLDALREPYKPIKMTTTTTTPQDVWTSKREMDDSYAERVDIYKQWLLQDAGMRAFVAKGRN